MEKALTLGKQIIVNKNVRSTAVLIITIIIVFAIDSLLPILEGGTHYTENAIEYTYAEYKALKESNDKYQLTWVSERSIELYVLKYTAQHPEISAEDALLIEPPDYFKVKVYTKYFFAHIYWYLTTLLHTLSAVMVFYSVFNFILTRRKQNDVKYVELSQELDLLSDTKLDPATFEPWMVNEFNYKRKLKQHQSNIKYLLDKLDQKTDYRIRLLAKRDPDNPECAEYLSAKNQLKYYLTDEYINEYLMDIEVKNFVYIHPTFVTSGYNAIGRTIDSFSLIRSNGQRLRKDGVSKVLTATCLTVLLSLLMTITVIGSFDKPWYWVLINIIITIAPLIIQVVLAYDYCDKYMEEQLITNLVHRRTIAFLYLASQKEVQHAEQDQSRDGHDDIGTDSDRNVE